MKMILTPATTPDGYIGFLTGWQRRYAEALRDTVRAAAPVLEERLKWGHLVYFCNGPVLVIRAEPARVLFAFMRGQRLRHIEPRLKPGGKYELATLELRPDTPLTQATTVQLAVEATRLNQTLGDPTSTAPTQHARAGAGARLAPSTGKAEKPPHAPVPHLQLHKDGTVWARGQTLAGQATGYWEWFRKNGVRLRSGHFDNGEQVGAWTTYDAAGKVYKVTAMKRAAKPE
jgi:hypothetical protein